MTKQTNQTIIYFSIIVVAIASIFWVNGLILAWSPPSASPPNSNVAAPINTSGTAQTKSGSLYVQGSELGVNGELYVCGSSGCTHFAYDNGGGTNYLRGPTYFNSVLYDENNPGYYVDPASTSRLNYGVYDNLYSYGWMQSATAMYAPAFYYSSDESLKKNISIIPNALDKVLKLEGVSFEWKDKEKGEGVNIGFIAQDVEEIFPEVVSTDANGLKSLQYGNLVAPLIEAIKEQQKQIKEQQVQIDELKKEIEELRK
ncbi:MAG: tail fiber domain-containing protein [Patescibacteria group bacterium]